MTGPWADEAGDPGHPLIALVHGSMDRSAGLLRLSRKLSERYRVLRFDRRGYARSHPHPGPFTMDEQVADLIGLLAGRRAVLVGHSYGGNVVLATAQRHRHAVAAAAVYEVPLSWEPDWPGLAATAIPRHPDPAAAAERFLRRMLGHQRWEALPERTKAARRAEGATMVAELGDISRNQPWFPADLTLPVVVGHGSEGFAHHCAGARRLAASLPQGRLVVVPGAAHDAPMSHPAEFARLVVTPALVAAGGDWAAAAER